MIEKVQCGGLMERSNLCLVEVLGVRWEPEKPCGILTKFGEKGIPLSYLSVGHGASGDKNMSFCVSIDDMSKNHNILEEIHNEFRPGKIDTREPVVILTLYGPHFLEKHALASEAVSALCVQCVDTLTVCSSVNSISMVVGAFDRDRTVACLKNRFTWPE